jgi:hypothetical protein
MITSAELWLAVEVLFYIVFFAFWDMIAVSIFGVDPATRSMVENVLLAIAIAFGTRIVKLTEKVETLEAKISDLEKN